MGTIDACGQVIRVVPFPVRALDARGMAVLNVEDVQELKAVYFDNFYRIGTFFLNTTGGVPPGYQLFSSGLPVNRGRAL